VFAVDPVKNHWSNSKLPVDLFFDRTSLFLRAAADAGEEATTCSTRPTPHDVPQRNDRWAALGRLFPGADCLKYLPMPVWLNDWGCVLLREMDFLFKNFANAFNSAAFVEASYLNTDMCKFESSQKGEKQNLVCWLLESLQQTYSFCASTTSPLRWPIKLLEPARNVFSKVVRFPVLLCVRFGRETSGSGVNWSPQRPGDTSKSGLGAKRPDSVASTQWTFAMSWKLSFVRADDCHLSRRSHHLELLSRQCLLWAWFL